MSNAANMSSSVSTSNATKQDDMKSGHQKPAGLSPDVFRSLVHQEDCPLFKDASPDPDDLDETKPGNLIEKLDSSGTPGGLQAMADVLPWAIGSCSSGEEVEFLVKSLKNTFGHTKMLERVGSYRPRGVKKNTKAPKKRKLAKSS